METSNSPRRALICGVTGQDGAYLAELLLRKGYQVIGTSRDAAASLSAGIDTLGIRERIRITQLDVEDFQGVRQAIAFAKPHEVFNLAGQTSVGLSFEQPLQTMRSISLGTGNILEAIRLVDPSIRFFNAGSGEVYGDTGGKPAGEDTPLQPHSPYAAAKAAAMWQVAIYRETFGLYACTGILFNHESPFRPERFVTRKIVAAAHRIAMGSDEKLKLGNIDVRRDWGWAPEYVDAMWRTLQQDLPLDYVIATGVTQSLRDFIAAAFAEAGLDWHDHVIADKKLHRASDPMESNANPGRARNILEWVPACVGAEVARRMYQAESVSSGELNVQA
jgi:GDPmannose 4,6-dehydratase